MYQMKIYQLTTVFTSPGPDRHRQRDARTKLLRIHWSWRISVPQPSLVPPATSLARDKPRIPTISPVPSVSSNLQVSAVLHGSGLTYAGLEPADRPASITNYHAHLAILPALLSNPGINTCQSSSHQTSDHQQVTVTVFKN